MKIRFIRYPKIILLEVEVLRFRFIQVVEWIR